MKRNKIIFGFLLFLLIAFLYNSKPYINRYIQEFKNYSAVFFSVGRSVDDLLHKYSNTIKNEK